MRKGIQLRIGKMEKVKGIEDREKDRGDRERDWEGRDRERMA